ncbi:FMN-binding negative transcriptional regulator [Bradyrhizobium sp. S3.3.6]|uniref:FMN-binding negative transcriptional regulator n=1 Tax=Bradyrhizobium sp. S3.3.6 TaxID=3156429 RepID=UPI00339383E0
MGTICARLARSNLQWKLTPTGEAMAIFAGAQAYISPSWYVTMHDTGEPYRRATMSRCMPTIQLSSSMARGR